MKATVDEYPATDDYTVNPLLGQLSFSESPPTVFKAEEAFLCPPQVERSQSSVKELPQLQKYAWVNHPIARRSFAMFPPVLEIYFTPEYLRDLEAKSAFGVTMEHVVRAMVSK